MFIRYWYYPILRLYDIDDLTLIPSDIDSMIMLISCDVDTILIPSDTYIIPSDIDTMRY